MAVEIYYGQQERTFEKNRLWQGCPTVFCTPKGLLYAGFYSGGTLEPSLDNFNLLICSRDGGRSWSEPILTIHSSPGEETVAIDIQLWENPQGHMVLNWTQRDFRFPKNAPEHLSLHELVCEDPDADTPVWSGPRVAGCGFLRCQPTVLHNGDIIRCDYDWVDEYYNYSRSADGGRSWTRHHAAAKMKRTDFDESMVLETQDGTLRFFARNVAGIAECYSKDGGKSWSEASLCDFQSPPSRFFIKRLRSGNVLMIRNDDPKVRSNMTAFLSEDDGRTFPFSLVLDERINVSYPDAVEIPDGALFIVYDRGRYDAKEILSARITEDDIRRGAVTQSGSWLRRTVSKAPEVPLCGEEKFNELREADLAFRKAHGM